jgi:hypothetical protein
MKYSQSKEITNLCFTNLNGVKASKWRDEDGKILYF